MALRGNSLVNSISCKAQLSRRGEQKDEFHDIKIIRCYVIDRDPLRVPIFGERIFRNASIRYSSTVLSIRACLHDVCTVQ